MISDLGVKEYGHAQPGWIQKLEAVQDSLTVPSLVLSPTIRGYGPNNSRDVDTFNAQGQLVPPKGFGIIPGHRIPYNPRPKSKKRPVPKPHVVTIRNTKSVSACAGLSRMCVGEMPVQKSATGHQGKRLAALAAQEALNE